MSIPPLAKWSIQFSLHYWRFLSVFRIGLIVHIKLLKLRIFSLYVDLKLIYFVFGDFDWIFVLAIVMRMTMGDRMVSPPDTLHRFIPSGDMLWGDRISQHTGISV